MKQAQTLSIVIPAYNEESYIQLCLEAIARQTVMPDQVIVVDNNSSDKTATIAARYPFVTLLHEKQQGLYFSRQTGMDAATGDILCRIDADTVIDEHWVEAIKDTFAEHKVSALTGPVGYHDFVAPKLVRWLEHKFLLGALNVGYDFLFGCNMAMTRAAWKAIEVELCNEPFIMEDMDITMHLKQHGITATYSHAMSVMVSMRRVDDKPRDFHRYITGHSRTRKHHDLSAMGARYVEASFIAGYLLVKPFHMGYDPEIRRLSVKKFITPVAARPDPMAVEIK